MAEEDHKQSTTRSRKVSLKFLPRSLRSILLRFQKQGIRYGIEKRGRCLIGDEGFSRKLRLDKLYLKYAEYAGKSTVDLFFMWPCLPLMGLGKTLQAIAIAYYYKAEWPLLIITPASLCFQWVDALEDWLPDIVPGVINLVRGFADLNSILEHKISVLSYGLLSFSRTNVLLTVLKKRGFGVAILDESHYIKNQKSQRTKRTRDALYGIKRVILLTGTPSLARPEELYPQVSILQPKLFGSFVDFGRRYCNGQYVVEYASGGRPYYKFDTKNFLMNNQTCQIPRTRQSANDQPR